jgi:hypothetical protein
MRHAHGGYITSLLFSTARAYFTSKYPSLQQPDPINVHIQFILPVQIGKVRLDVSEISIRRQYSVAQITLKKLHPENSTYQTHVTAIITQGNLATENGQTIPVPPIILKDEIPNIKAVCEESIIPEWIRKLLPVSTKLRSFKRRGGESRVLSRKGLNVREIWMRWTDEKQKFNVISLGTVCDNVSMRVDQTTNISRLDSKLPTSFHSMPFTYIQ